MTSTPAFTDALSNMSDMQIMEDLRTRFDAKCFNIALKIVNDLKSKKERTGTTWKAISREWYLRADNNKDLKALPPKAVSLVWRQLNRLWNELEEAERNTIYETDDDEEDYSDLMIMD